MVFFLPSDDFNKYNNNNGIAISAGGGEMAPATWFWMSRAMSSKLDEWTSLSSPVSWSDASLADIIFGGGGGGGSGSSGGSSGRGGDVCVVCVVVVVLQREYSTLLVL